MKIKLFLFIAVFLASANFSFAQGFFFLSDTAGVSQYYSSGGHNAELRAVIVPAIEHFKNLTVNSNDAIVMDIDETALSNFNIFRQSNYQWDEKLFTQSITNETAPAIKPVFELYNILVEKGFKIFFITGRSYSESNYTHTIGNLQKEGYNQIDTLILHSKRFSGMTAQEYKATIRAELTKAGYNIVGTIGDQWSDLGGGNSGYMVRVPNYLYYTK